MANQMDELVAGVARVEQAIKGQLFPVPPGSTPAYKNSAGAATSVVLDGSGNIPTTASLSIASVDGRLQDGANTTIVATVLDYVSSNPLAVRLTDTNGDYVAAAGGSTTTVVQANAGTNLNTSLLALEAGGNLAAIKAKTDNIPVLGQAADTGSLPVVLTSAQVTTLTPPAAITGFALETGGNLASIKAKTDNIPAQGQAVEAASLPVVLPAAQVTTLTPPAAITGFALETGGNLASIKAKTDNIPALGQAADTGSLPVVLTSAQVTTLTPPAAITGFALESGGNLANAAAYLLNLAGTVSNVTTTALQSSLIVKASAGRLMGVNGYNANTSSVFMQLHDSATVPADTVVPVVSFTVPATSNFSLDYGLRGRNFANGIILVTSTSQAVKVLGAANTFADAQYI